MLSRQELVLRRVQRYPTKRLSFSSLVSWCSRHWYASEESDGILSRIPKSSCRVRKVVLRLLRRPSHVKRKFEAISPLPREASLVFFLNRMQNDIVSSFPSFFSHALPRETPSRHAFDVEKLLLFFSKRDDGLLSFERVSVPFSLSRA